VRGAAGAAAAAAAAAAGGLKPGRRLQAAHRQSKQCVSHFLLAVVEERPLLCTRGLHLHLCV
jgi:hypothetical protein